MKKCLLCGSEALEIVEELSAQQLVEDWKRINNINITAEMKGFKEISRIHCIACDLQFYSPELAGSAGLYEKLQKFDWYYMPHKWEHSTAAEDIFDGDRVLEVGCGVGDFVEWLQNNKNAEAVGLELNVNAAEKAQSLGRSVMAKSINEMAHIERGMFDVVCSFQVLEHVVNPNDFIHQSLQLIKQGGKLIVCVPNDNSFLKYQYNLFNLPPHHISRWSPRCISNISDLFDIKLLHRINEPLAEYHVEGYLNAYMSKIRNWRMGKLLSNSHTKRWLRWGINHTLIRQLLKGQSIYACYVKN
jgi:2-polyprenyl-3-methyl-5-hydroxy-6-metoxy-1,4-benzoquinol methylase